MFWQNSNDSLNSYLNNARYTLPSIIYAWDSNKVINNFINNTITQGNTNAIKWRLQQSYSLLQLFLPAL